MKKLMSFIITIILTISMTGLTSYADSWKKTDKGYVYTYSNGTTAPKGWLYIDDNTYYIQKDGTRKTGWFTIANGDKYYFSKDGTMVKNKKLKFSNGRYYFLPNGKMACDYCLKEGNSFYYYGSDGNLQYTANLKLGMKYSELYNVVDETYFYNNVDGVDLIGRLDNISNTQVITLYMFYDNTLLNYGYCFDKNDINLETIKKYFTKKFGASPNYVNPKSGEFYWKFKSYYFSVYYDDNNIYASYSPICLVDEEPTTSTTVVTKSPTTNTTPTTTTKPTSTTHTIYVTRTGKKYHYDGHCNGGTYYESTYEEATRRHLTPCEKCVK